MSKDIRSFFTPLGSGKKKDTKHEEIVPKVHKKKRAAVISDSDDEDDIFIRKKTKVPAENCSKYFGKDAKKTVPQKKPDPVLKPVKAADVFGCEAVKRSTKKTSKAEDVEVPESKKVKKKRPPSITIEDSNDMDFEATLMQLDEIEASALKQIKEVENVKKENVSDESKDCGEPSNKNAVRGLSEKNGNAKKEVNSPDLKPSIKSPEEKKRKLADVKTESNEVQSTSSESLKSTTLTNGHSKQKEKYQKTSLDEEKTKKTLNTDSDESSKSESKSAKTPYVRKKHGAEYTDSEDDDKGASKKSKLEHKANKVDSAKKERKKTTPKSKTKEEDEPYWAHDPAEKRRLSAIGYQRYLQREGPKHLGAKEIPKGNPGCLKGLVFVITGVLDSIERDAAASLIQECGGRVTSSISRNTSYIVIGDDAGPSKVHKAEQLGTHQLNEDEFFDLIRTKSGLPTHEQSKDPPDVDTKRKETLNQDEKVEPKTKTSLGSPKKLKSKQIETSDDDKHAVQSPSSSHVTKSPLSQAENFYGKKADSSQELKQSTSKVSSPSESATSRQNTQLNLMWVDKYRPTSLKQIIGQQGDRSNVKKLVKWLQNWHHNQFGGKKLSKPGPWCRDDDGAYFKAALLSGPPGVGKTTTAHLVCKELGLDLVEFNASDTRSKRLLSEDVSELLSTKSLHDYFTGSKNGKTSSNHVLIMDEVDGMAGNEDRGGMQELIHLIKNSKIPIICTCNNVHHPKVRSLLGYCFDLRFQKPKVEQIRGAMQSVCFKEGLKIPPNVLTDMITGSNQDVRQVLHHLSLYAAKGVTLPGEAKDAACTHILKHVKLGPWEVLSKVFNAEEHKHMTLNDKSDLFFHDYNISPLFVQENYLSVLPDQAKNNTIKRLDLIAQAANSICMGDTVERAIRSKNAWSLLPIQAMYASVIPGDLLEGRITQQINFPSWLGKNSRRNKFDRLLQELHSHMRLSMSGNKQALTLDYVPRLCQAVTLPMVRDGVDGVPASAAMLHAYNLLRTDIDYLTELGVWPGETDPMSKIDGKVKAALTRSYNKDLVLPYSNVTNVSKKKSVALTLDEVENEEEEEDEKEDDDDVTGDAMIKAKKRPASKTPSVSGPSTSKKGRTESDRGGGGKRGRGRGKK